MWWTSSFYPWKDTLSMSSPGAFLLNFCCGLCIQTQTLKLKSTESEKEVWANEKGQISTAKVEVYRRSNLLNESLNCESPSKHIINSCENTNYSNSEFENNKKRHNRLETKDIELSRKRKHSKKILRERNYRKLDRENLNLNRKVKSTNSRYKNEFPCYGNCQYCSSNPGELRKDQNHNMDHKNNSEDNDSLQSRDKYEWLCANSSTTSSSTVYNRFSNLFRVSPRTRDLSVSNNTQIVGQFSNPQPPSLPNSASRFESFGGSGNQSGNHSGSHALNRKVHLPRMSERKDCHRNKRGQAQRQPRGGFAGGPHRLPSFDEISDAIGPQAEPSPSYKFSRCALRRQFSLENGTLERRQETEQMQCELPPSESDTSDQDGKKNTDHFYQEMEEEGEQEVSGINRSTPLSNQDDIKYKCLALWQLRSTLEDSDPEEMSSDHPSEGGGRGGPLKSEVYSQNGKEESSRMETDEVHQNTDMIENAIEPTDNLSLRNNQSAKPPSNASSRQTTHLTPAEERRLSYRRILSQRLKRLGIPSETSFDSIDTDTSSMTDVFNTSVDSSTTDNHTDSDCSAANRLRQMQSDSGYRSLETNSKDTYQKQNSESYRSIDLPCTSNELGYSKSIPIPIKCSSSFSKTNGTQWHPDDKNGYLFDDDKTTTKKERRKSTKTKRSSCSMRSSAKTKREILGEWQQLSFESDVASGKRSVMARFFQTHRSASMDSPPSAVFQRNKFGNDFPRAYDHSPTIVRDYSIDEKTDRIFREFSKVDVPNSEQQLQMGRLKNHHLSPKNSNRGDLGTFKDSTLYPMDHKETSPLRIRRKLSPHESIEEEECEFVDTSRLFTRLEDRQNIDPKETAQYRNKM